ncbi:hypothetical protein TSAR_011185 [Trichomalopsis sarcophagae]|uniref:Mitogen-activated protein kinase kinase kinase N-terminal domain-containing protein n=1 Tax=Trichomalopsis sarcophagae TaxID=543379 RepID=A0A232F355_9HYME|nr:hypothetical protein TSAR_011185 [Trichomalopsis sarcophagae]
MYTKLAIVLNLLNLAAFVFLSRVPLDVIHEFLRIRLEQKPKQPSPLSVRQLMRELREGLRIACIHRERFAEHSSTAAACEGSSTTLFDKDVKEFDESLKSVFNVYLDYLKQWVLMVQHDSFHKNLVQDEWNFVKSIARKINNGTIIASRKFCQIAKIMVAQINKFFSDGPQEFRKTAFMTEENNTIVDFKNEWVLNFAKHHVINVTLDIFIPVPVRDSPFLRGYRNKLSHLISVGREWQALFDEAREKLVKIVILSKCLRNDIRTFPGYERVLKEFVNSLMVTIMDSHNRKNGGDQSCRISKGQPDGDLGFDLERVFQGHLKVNFGFLNRNPILLLRE